MTAQYVCLDTIQQESENQMNLMCCLDGSQCWKQNTAQAFNVSYC